MIFDFAYLDRIRKVLISIETRGITVRELHHKTRSTAHPQSDLELILAHWHRRRWVDRYVFHNGKRYQTIWRATTLLLSDWQGFLPLIEAMLLQGLPEEVLAQAQAASSEQDASQTRTSHPEEAVPPRASAD